MASLDSYIRSAARATSSAYRRIPIRWRLAGGSAALTLVILLTFAAVVGALTTRRIHDDFNEEVAIAADSLQRSLVVRFAGYDRRGDPTFALNVDLDSYAAGQRAVIRVVSDDGEVLTSSRFAPELGTPRRASASFGGYRVETRGVTLRDVTLPGTRGTVYVQFARPIAEIDETTDRVRAFLFAGMIGGSVLALLAGLATARRAMRPVAELTETARAIQRTGDPEVRIRVPEARDEVAELAETLAGMLRSLADARSETETLLARQREFVADASHELRTPLTSILANLELLEEVLSGDQRDAAASALRSANRMRRLVADLLLLARHDAGREAPHELLDVGEVVKEAAAEMEPLAGDHAITVDIRGDLAVLGSRDELHRLVANLLENALRHTDPGTAVEATATRRNGQVVIAVEDDGPGIPPEQRQRVFERFYRGAGEQSGSSGLGLAIVKAVAEAHGGSVRLEPPLDGRGARFVVRLPPA